VDSKRIARYFAGYWLASNRDLREFCDCERIRADCSEQLSPALVPAACTRRHIPPVGHKLSRLETAPRVFLLSLNPPVPQARVARRDGRASARR
jgi:hypothetical protein